ncbi:Uncharacterized protein Fot_39106 [Forsythia ovata]|uniref:Uncharacterized protein n=1 Tax=Forsythia ovata TaxID=205694 RepID=A0ABD1S3N6_9LAMI
MEEIDISSMVEELQRLNAEEAATTRAARACARRQINTRSSHFPQNNLINSRSSANVLILVVGLIILSQKPVDYRLISIMGYKISPIKKITRSYLFVESATTKSLIRINLYPRCLQDWKLTTVTLPSLHYQRRIVKVFYVRWG